MHKLTPCNLKSCTPIKIMYLLSQHYLVKEFYPPAIPITSFHPFIHLTIIIIVIVALISLWIKYLVLFSLLSDSLFVYIAKGDVVFVVYI